ncbi:MAG: tetrahydromethanopterin S-methyltransferase subunit A [Candidatus Hydrothermarchaeota archaeon]
MEEILKVKPCPDYPPEEGRYLRGNDYSPVAVVAILNTWDTEIPLYLEEIVRVSIETGAALAGMLQTENIGIEKIITNVVANPNIRYIILCGRESLGHLTGDAFIAFIKNGVDKKRKIIGTEAPTPFLYNVKIEAIERFRNQITLIDLLNEGSPDVIREAVRSCYQEEPTEFMGYRLYDPGAYPEPPICGKITWKVREPWTYLEKDDAIIVQKIRDSVKKPEKPQTWYVFKEGRKYGPVDLKTVKEWIREGRLTVHDLVWTSSFDNWKKIKDVDDFWI